MVKVGDVLLAKDVHRENLPIGSIVLGCGNLYHHFRTTEGWVCADVCIGDPPDWKFISFGKYQVLYLGAESTKPLLSLNVKLDLSKIELTDIPAGSVVQWHRSDGGFGESYLVLSCGRWVTYRGHSWKPGKIDFTSLPGYLTISYLGG